MADETVPAGRFMPDSRGLSVLTDLMGRYMAWRGVSQTAFGGDRDYYTILGYPVDISFDMYEAKYRRQDVAKAVVTVPASATWKDAPALRFVDGAKTKEKTQTAFLSEWASTVRRVRLWERLRRADIRAGLGQYSVIVLGFKGRGAWSVPLKKKLSSGDLVYLAVYDEPDAKIDALVSNPEDERFNQPEYYQINTGNGDNVRAHWTKVIHVCEDAEKDDLYGTPRMESCYNILDALMKVVHGGAEAVWHGMVGTFHADVREGYELTEDDEEALTEAIDEFLNGLRRVIQTEGVDLTRLAAQITDTSPAYETCIELLCAATKIPRTILIGSDRGDVSKKEEARRWAAVIGERRSSFAEPIIRTIIERLVDYGSLPEVNVDEIEIVWPPLFELSLLEMAELAEARGRAVAAVSVGTASDVYVSPTEVRSWMGLEARPEGEREIETVGLRTILAKITQVLTMSGASIYSAALTAGFTETEAKALAAWSPVPTGAVPGQLEETDGTESDEDADIEVEDEEGDAEGETAESIPGNPGAEEPGKKQLDTSGQ